jgi:hypothetical protein
VRQALGRRRECCSRRSTLSHLLACYQPDLPDSANGACSFVGVFCVNMFLIDLGQEFSDARALQRRDLESSPAQPRPYRPSLICLRLGNCRQWRCIAGMRIGGLCEAFDVISLYTKWDILYDGEPAVGAFLRLQLFIAR